MQPCICLPYNNGGINWGCSDYCLGLQTFSGTGHFLKLHLYEPNELENGTLWKPSSKLGTLLLTSLQNCMLYPPWKKTMSWYHKTWHHEAGPHTVGLLWFLEGKKPLLGAPFLSPWVSQCPSEECWKNPCHSKLHRSYVLFGIEFKAPSCWSSKRWRKHWLFQWDSVCLTALI